MKQIAPSLIVLLLAGCQTTAGPLREAAPDFRPPAGTQLILQRALVIPAGHASVYLQFGQTLRYADVNTYHPHCRFEVREVGERPQTIVPDGFRVMRASHEYRSTVRAGERTQWAAAGGALLARKDDGGSSPQAYVTLMALQSQRQPQVLSLACGHWSHPPEDRHLSLAGIRSALGAIFTLQLPATARDGGR